jgi:hypothetical protein
MSNKDILAGGKTKYKCLKTMGKENYLWVLISFLGISIGLIAGCKGKTVQVRHEVTPTYFYYAFTEDSGYLQKKTGLAALLASGHSDTSHSDWSLWKDGDTIAKYYRNREDGNITMLIADYGSNNTAHQFYIMSINPFGKVLEKRHEGSADFCCCWQNYDELFQRVGPYYILRSCEQGPSYCASSAVLFKKPSDIDSAEHIPDYLYDGVVAADCRLLSSEFILHDDSIFVAYTLEMGTMDEENRWNTKQRKHFNVPYLWTGSGLRCLAKSKFELSEF